MKSKKKRLWTVTYGAMEEGRQCECAGIKTPEGKSIFQIEFDMFMGLSNHMAERIVKILNEGRKAL